MMPFYATFWKTTVIGTTTTTTSVVARDQKKGEWKGLITKGHNDTFWSDGNILCLNCRGSS